MTRSALHRHRGAAGHQYAIIAGLVAMAAILAVTLVGRNLVILLTGIDNRLQNGAASSGATSGGGGTGGGSAAPSCTTTGGLDSSFAIGSGFDDNVYALARMSDGRIVVGGSWFTNYNGTPRSRIAAVNTTAGLSASFNPGTAPNGGIYVMESAPGDKVLVGGWFTTWNGVAAPSIVRLDSNGALDSSFNVGTGPTNDVMAIAVQSDGKYLVAGPFSSWSGGSGGIVRLNTDGTRDAGFAYSGSMNWDAKVVPLPGGKILVSGGVSGSIARLNSDGTRDNSFALSGMTPTGDPKAVALLSGGRILVGGMWDQYTGNSLYVLGANGAVERSFAVTGNHYAFASQSDGKIIATGNFGQFEGATVNKIVRINADGTHDPSLVAPSSAVIGPVIRAVLVQPDGKIVIGGDFNGKVARLACE